MNQKRNENDTSELLTIAFEKANLAASYYSKGELDMSLQAYNETTIFLRHIVSKTEDKSDLFRLNKMYNKYDKRIREISKSVSYNNNLRQDQARFSLKLPSKEYCMSKELPTILDNEFKNIEQSNTYSDKQAFMNQHHDLIVSAIPWETKVKESNGTIRSKMRDTINKRIKSLDASNIIKLKKIMYESKRDESLGDHKRQDVFKQNDNTRKFNQIEFIDPSHTEQSRDEKPKKRKGPGSSLPTDSSNGFIVKRSPFTKRLVIKKRNQHDTTDKEDLTLFLESPYKSLGDMSQSHTIFLLIHRLYKCLTCGGYLTDKLHLPIDIWYQSSVRLSSLNIKIKNCNDISTILENSKEFDLINMIHIKKGFQEVTELNKKRNKNFGYKKGHDKASQILWGSEITRYIKRIQPSNMKSYLNALIRLFKAAKVFESWHKIVSGDDEKQMLYCCLKLFSNIFCNFVIKDCLILLDEWIRNGKNCIMD